MHRTTYMENCQPVMASTLAAAMVTPEDPYNWEHGYAVQEITEHIGKLVELHVEGKSAALRVVQKFHRDLSYSSTASLAPSLNF